MKLNSEILNIENKLVLLNEKKKRLKEITDKIILEKDALKLNMN